MTTRTFQHRVTIVAMVTIILVAVAALCFLMLRTRQGAILGFFLICLDVAAIERVIHTSYTFTDNGQLLISRGRFARQRVIPVNEIIKAEERQSPLRTTRYILIEYGNHRLTSAQPDNPTDFLSEIIKRQQKIDDEM